VPFPVHFCQHRIFAIQVDDTAVLVLPGRGWS
jgi:hypothetical protein